MINSFLNKHKKKEVVHYSDSVPNDVEISVCVQTFQHEKFIANCLDRILAQKTNVNFEILLGEDESTDETRNICIKYAQKYPNKIRLFLHHRENNIKISGSPTGRFNFLYNLTQAKGKYIAFCEGDDYWKDPFKLQKQFDAMEENKDCSICFTAAEYHYLSRETNEMISKKIYRPKNAFDGKKFTLKEAIRPAGGFMPSASMFIRKKYLSELPNWFFNAIVGDTPLTLYLGTKGDFLYLDSATCVYQIGTQGSWTHSSDHSKRKKRVEGYIWILDQFDEYSNYRYQSKIRIQKIKLRIGLMRSLIKKQLRPLRKFSLVDKIAKLTGN